MHFEKMGTYSFGELLLGESIFDKVQDPLGQLAGVG